MLDLSLEISSTENLEIMCTVLAPSHTLPFHLFLDYEISYLFNNVRALELVRMIEDAIKISFEVVQKVF
jgi:hypothetical protein